MKEHSNTFYKNNLQEYTNPLVYDLENQWAADDDFFLELASNCKGRILDIGCGTGRLARRIAELGKDVIGLDVVPGMLEQARKLSENLNVKWTEQDCRTFQLLGKFDLILMTSHGFQHLLTTKDQVDFFNAANCHLKDGGILAFDTRNLENKAYGNNLEMEFKRKMVNNAGQSIQVYMASQYDKATQLDHAKIERKNLTNGEAHLSEIYLKYTSQKELNKTLTECGFQIVHQYGFWDKSPFTQESPELITICKK